MKRWFVLFGGAALVLALASGCDKNDDATNPDDGDGNPNRADSLVIARDFPPLLANGVDHATVHATVVDGRGRGMGGIGVRFATNHGAITPFATTDNAGTATATLTSEASPTDVFASVSAATTQDSAGAKAAPDARVLLSRLPLSPTMIARALEEAETAPEGASKDAVGGTVTAPMVGVTVTVAADPQTIPADGITQSRVTARVIETTRRVPLAGQEVLFGASSGAITGSVMTDGTGTASASLTGVEGGDVSEITVYYGRTLTAETSVLFSGLSLTVRAESAALLADGRSSTQIVARLMTAERNPVVQAAVEFTTTLGAVTASAATNSLGEATATLVASDTTGTAHVTARFRTMSASADVEFAALPAAASVLLSCDPSSMPADGASVATLTATVLDEFGFPVPDGTPVLFTIVSGGGQIVAPLAATAGGAARAVYVAGTAAGPVSISAASGTASATASIVLASQHAMSLTLSASSTSILADGMASTILTASVVDALGNPVAPGTAVEFSTSRGRIEEVTPTGAGGTATARLRAVRFETGLARVAAMSGEASTTLDVNFTSEAAAHIEAMGVDHPSIGILGASEHETATIFFEVQDRNGIPVDASHAVTLSFSVTPASGDPDPTIYPASAVTNQNGQAAATLSAGVIAGTVEVRAGSGSLISQPIRVAIHGDLPDPAHFSVFPHRLNIPGLVFANYDNEICAKVADAFSNPVVDSTAVYFNTQFGIIQGSGLTDVIGDACVNMISAAPFPAIPGGDGLVEVCAQTVSKAGDRIVTCTHVMWSGPTMVEITSPDTFDVRNGGSVTITYRVHDANDNPLTGGTRIAVSSTSGALGGDSNLTLPDTQSREYTTFHVVLSDDDPLEDLEKPVTVTVDVQSENGNRRAYIVGTMH